MTDNLRYWDRLCKTDPDHTKPITGRPGGFRGTAIKPIWTIKRMTEVFGPVGIGWGTEKPDFQLVPVGEEVAVYCTLCCWYNEGDARYFVFGMGGDTVTKFKDGKKWIDDEAFKKAFTDALTNALKHIGAAADVHMGMFEDSKYVQIARKQFDASGKFLAPIAPEPSSLGPDLDAFAASSDGPFAKIAYEKADLGTEAFREWWKPLSASLKNELKGIIKELEKRAKAADDKMLPRIDVVKVNGKPNWEATVKALVAEFVQLMTVEECNAFDELNQPVLKMIYEGDRNQYDAYRMVTEAHVYDLTDRSEAAQ